MEQVCGHSYKVELTDQEQEVCVDLETIDCIQKNITVTDTDRVEGLEFNCSKMFTWRREDVRRSVRKKCTNLPREVKCSFLKFYHSHNPLIGYLCSK